MEKEFVYFVDDTWIDQGNLKMPAVPRGCFKTLDLAVFYVGTKCGSISKFNKNKYDIRVSIYNDGFSDEDIRKNLVQSTIITVTEKDRPDMIESQHQFNIYKHPFYSKCIDIE